MNSLSPNSLFWLVNVAEPLPFDPGDVRLMRMGQLAEILVARGHRVIWWSCDFLHFEKKHRVIENLDFEYKPGYSFRILQVPGYRKNVSIARYLSNLTLMRNFRTRAQKEMSIERPSAILCSLPTVELAHECVGLGLRAGIPVAIDLRDMWPDIIVDRFPKSFRYIVKLALMPLFNKMKSACSKANAIFGITPGFVNWGLAYAGRSARENDRSFPLSYSAKLASKTPTVEALQWWRERGVAEADFVLCYIGSLRPQVDISTIIACARRLGPSYKFVIAGTGPGIEALRLESADLSNVVWPGWIGADQIRALGSLSKIGLAPYKTSRDFFISIPNKPIEYMAMGLPVLTCLEGELKAFVETHDCGGFYRAGDVDGLIAEIEKLKFDENLKRKAANAKHVFLSHFTSEKVVTQMAETLEAMGANGID